VFVIIKTFHKDGVSNFSLFDDDKSNDHIDHKGKKYILMLVSNIQATRVKEKFKKST